MDRTFQPRVMEINRILVLAASCLLPAACCALPAACIVAGWYCQQFYNI